MKKILIALLLISCAGRAQNIPACDSLVITCCDYLSGGPGTITLQVSNSSSVLFDYPAFALFDATMDTIAKETVMYFGISQGPQLHTLVITTPFLLPFNGTLNLYTLFYDSLACSFPITIPDTVLNVEDPFSYPPLVFPNPADAMVKIQFPFADNETIQLFSADGRLIKSIYIHEKNSSIAVDTKLLPAGMYAMHILGNGKAAAVVKLAIVR